MNPLHDQFTDYQQLHQQHFEKITHWIAVPAILIGLLLLLNWVSVSFGKTWHISFAWLAVIATLVYYYFHDVKLAAVMTIVFIIVNLICTWIAYPAPTTFSLVLFIILFVGGLVCYFINYSLQTKKPKLQDGIHEALLTPLFLVILLFQRLHIASYFGFSTSETNKKAS